MKGDTKPSPIVLANIALLESGLRLGFGLENKERSKEDQSHY